MPIVADAAVAIRGDLSKFVSDLRPAETSVTSLGAKLKAALSPPGVGGISGDFTNLATALDRAQREADEALTALRALSRADLPEEDARKYADAINDIESEAKVTASELRQLQSAQPEFDTPELRQAAQGLDKVGDEANELGNEFRELARQNPDATLAKAARESKSLASGMDSAGKSSTGLLTKLRSVQGALIGLGLAIGAQQILGFFGDAIEAASSLGETTAATSQIFGEVAMPALEKWASTAAEAFGQSQQQALDAANTFATFGKSAGLAGDDLVGFSTELTQLASDMASFKDTTPEEAITAIGAALRGESEPIRRYGVLLDEATLRQQALTLGIIDNIKTALTPQQRVLAANAAIWAQTTDLQGDFLRTSGGLANQQRRQAALLEDAMADLGEVLVPLALGFTRFAADALPEVISALKGLMGVLIPFGGLLAEHADVIIPALAAALGVKLVFALQATVAANKAAQAQAIATGVAFKGVGLAAKAAWSAALLGLPILIAGLGEASDAADDFFFEFRHGKKAVATLKELQDAAGDDLFGAKLFNWGVSVEDFSRVVEQADGDTDAAFHAIEDNAGNVGHALRDLGAEASGMSLTWAGAWRGMSTSVETNADGMLTSIKTVSGEAEDKLDRFLSNLEPAMNKAVQDVLATATEVPEGLSVTLENGKTIVAASADALAQVLPAAIKQARRDAVIAAYPAPAEIADAILAGKAEFSPVRQMLIDALVNPISDARSLARAQALLFDPLVGEALGKTGFSETQAAGLEGAGLLVDSILAVEPDIFDAGTKLPPAIARGFKSTRGDVIQAVRDLNNDQAMTAGEVATYLEAAGEDGLAALVRGIKSKKQDVRDAQDAINEAIRQRAALLHGIGVDAGGNLSEGVAEGMDASAWMATQAAARLASGVAGFLPVNSPPDNPNSPLANIMEVGGNIVRAIADDITKNLRMAQRATNALSASLVPDLVAGGSLGRMPSVPASAFASASGGDNINVYLPGRTRLATGSEIGDDLRVLGEQGQLKPKRKVPND